MCGIAGFLGLAGAPDARAATLDRMLAAIVHRGPDDTGAWFDPARGFAFGMRRLSIVDLAGGHQPIWNEDETVGIVFNGEIYNHRALRADLEARGHRFRTHSDTEVLVHLYEEHDTAMFARLAGMYGLAIVDRRRDTLLLARDPFGQKPLYLFRPSAEALTFASEPKALREVPGWRGEIDSTAYLDYASWFSLPAPGTHWRGVEKLRPGEWRRFALAGGRELESGRQRAIDFSAPPEDRGDEVHAAEMLAALEDSVRRHLEADVPVGLLLSGGTDSLVTGWITSRVTQARLHTFTAGFAGEDNEFAAARRTAALLASEHHEVMLEPDVLARELDRVLRHLDEPIADPAAAAVFRLCAAARQHVKVVLSGEGSDELFAGYGARYAGIVDTVERSNFLRRTLARLPGDVRGFGSGYLPRMWARAHLAPAAEILALRTDGLQPFLPWAQRHAPEALVQLRARCEARARELAPSSDPLVAAQQIDLAWQLPESLLVKADRMSMAASIELRAPFLDPVVAAAAARLPARLRLDRASATGKIILRRLLDRHLPAEANRPKIGFRLPLGRWLRGPLADDVRARLTDPASMFVATFGAAAAEAWWREFAAGGLSPHATYGFWIYERWRATSR